MPDRQTHTVDLQDRVEEIDDLLAGREDDMAAIESEAADLAPGSEAFDELDEEYDQLQDAVDTLQHARDVISDTIDEWGGSGLAIKELTFGDASFIQDEVMANANRTRREGIEANLGVYKLKTVETAVVSIPENAPDNANAWPPAVGEYVFEQIDALNTRGEAGTGNSSRSSLREQLETDRISADTPPS